MSTLERAIAVAATAHEGQVDKAGAPYVLHPLRVMASLEDGPARMAAVLHDVVEDTDWTLERLRAEGFPEEVVEAVDHLTRREGETYMEFCARTATHPLARRVKLADLADNLDLSRIPEPTDGHRSLMKRYEKARALLLAADPEAAADPGDPRAG